MMSRRFFGAVGAAVALIALVIVLRSSIGAPLVWDMSGRGSLLLPLVIVSALLDSLHPCAFAILLVTIAVLLGLGSLRSKLLVVGGTYIAGIFVAYFAIGLGLLGTLHIFGIPHFMGKLGAGVLVLWGIISLLNVMVPSFPIKLSVPQATHRTMAQLMGRASLAAAFGLGLLVGLCAFPCTGGPYLMVLGLLHDTATYSRGVAYLLLYNVLFVSPLVIVLFIAGDRTVVGRMEQWKRSNVRSMRLWMGVAMLAFGAVLFFFL